MVAGTDSTQTFWMNREKPCCLETTGNCGQLLAIRPTWCSITSDTTQCIELGSMAVDVLYQLVSLTAVIY